MNDDIINQVRIISESASVGMPDWTEVLRKAIVHMETQQEVIEEYKHRLHWLNEELLRRG